MADPSVDVNKAPAVPEIDTQKCDGCGECVARCPGQAADLVDGKATIARPEDCNYCTSCEELCPVHAIRCPYDILFDWTRS